MDNKLWDTAQAAEYLGLDHRWLLRQCRLGTGPRHVRPGPKTVLFAKHDLDTWRAGWVVCEAKTHGA